MTVIHERANWLSHGGKIIDADDMLDDRLSDILDMRGKPGKIGFHIRVPTNADAVGVIKVMQSNSPDTDHGVQVVFLDGSDEITIATGTTYNVWVDVEVYGRYVWVWWDFTSGTGTNVLDVWAEVKR